MVDAVGVKEALAGGAITTVKLDNLRDQIDEISARHPDNVSRAGNHISLNSLGLPFAQLQAIESAVRSAIRVGEHGPAELYMDDQFFHSLKWRYGFEKHKEPIYPYLAPMVGSPCEYVLCSFQRVIDNLKA